MQSMLQPDERQPWPERESNRKQFKSTTSASAFPKSTAQLPGEWPTPGASQGIHPGAAGQKGQRGSPTVSGSCQEFTATCRGNSSLQFSLPVPPPVVRQQEVPRSQATLCPTLESLRKHLRVPCCLFGSPPDKNPKDGSGFDKKAASEADIDQ